MAQTMSLHHITPFIFHAYTKNQQFWVPPSAIWEHCVTRNNNNSLDLQLFWLLCSVVPEKINKYKTTCGIIMVKTFWGSCSLFVGMLSWHFCKCVANKGLKIKIKKKPGQPTKHFRLFRCSLQFCRALTSLKKKKSQLQTNNTASYT